MMNFLRISKFKYEFNEDSDNENSEKIQRNFINVLWFLFTFKHLNFNPSKIFWTSIWTFIKDGS